MRLPPLVRPLLCSFFCRALLVSGRVRGSRPSTVASVEVLDNGGLRRNDPRTEQRPVQRQSPPTPPVRGVFGTNHRKQASPPPPPSGGAPRAHDIRAFIVQDAPRRVVSLSGKAATVRPRHGAKAVPRAPRMTGVSRFRWSLAALRGRVTHGTARGGLSDKGVLCHARGSVSTAALRRWSADASPP